MLIAQSVFLSLTWPNKIPTNQIRCPTIRPRLCFQTSLLKASQQRQKDKQVMKMICVDNSILLHRVANDDALDPQLLDMIFPTASKVTRSKATSGSPEAGQPNAGSSIIHTKPD